MSKSDTGRKARQNGRAFEQAIARDLRAWLGPEWLVSRLKTSYQAEAGGEFEIKWHPPMGLAGLDGGGPVFPVALECKRDARFKTDQLWKPAVSAAFREFWSQAVEQAEAVGKRPWLVLREPPRGPVLLVMRAASWFRLQAAAIRVGDLPGPVMSLRTHSLGVQVFREPLVVLPWSAFLESVPASALWELS